MDFIKNNLIKIKITFIIQVAAVFLVTFIVLLIFGLIPDEFYFNENNNVSDLDDSVALNNASIGTQTIPERITIPKVGIDSVIKHPNSQDVSVLDEALKSGAVYYPGSGYIEDGNVFLFGHSTNWKVVNNQAYKTFNGLDKLQKGDEIYLEAEGNTHVYEVSKVSLLDENAAIVDFSSGGRVLTISTCNTFGEKQERWVVEASYKMSK